MSRFQVLFSGEVAEGASEVVVRQNLLRRLGLDERKVAQLFSGRTVVIRSDLSREAADALQAELAGLGAIARIKDTTPEDKAKFKIDRHRDQTLKDITAAHVECPRCGHLQLESEFCARCGVDIATAAKQKRKEDILIEKRIRDLKTQKAVPGTKSESAAADALDVSERIEPIKRRSQRPTTRPPRPQMRPPQPNHAPSNRVGNPFGGGSGFWRNVLKLGRKDERTP
jgi:ribosomal protein L32